MSEDKGKFSRRDFFKGAAMGFSGGLFWGWASTPILPGARPISLS